MNNHTNQTVLITGGATGIGFAAARLFYSLGYQLILVGRRMAKINEAVSALKNEMGGAIGVWGYSGDVADEKAVNQWFNAFSQEGLTVDVLVNNAGIINPIGRITDTSPEEWLNNLKVNLFGAYQCARAVIPGMLEKGRGTIINIGSGAAYHPLEGWSAYCSSKAGLYHFTACLHEEYGNFGIRIFSYRPGMVDTPMQESIRQSGINKISQVKREDLIDPNLTAQGIVYLVSDGDGYRGKEADINDPDFRSRIEEIKGMGWIKESN